MNLNNTKLYGILAIVLLVIIILVVLSNNGYDKKNNSQQTIGTTNTTNKPLQFQHNNQKAQIDNTNSEILDIANNSETNTLTKNIENIIDDLYSNGFTFKKVKNLYQQILQEEDSTNLNEMIMSFFESLSMLDLSDSEYDKLQTMALDLIDNTKTRLIALKRAAQILDDTQMEEVFDKYKYELSDEEKQILTNQYANFRLINGKTPFNHEDMEKIYKKGTNDNTHNNKINSIIGMLNSQDQEQARKVAQQNFNTESNWDKNTNDIKDYIPWVRAKFLTMSGGDAQTFIINEFSKASFEVKNDFFIAGIDLIDSVSVQYIEDHIDELNNLYLDFIYKQQNFNTFQISGILNIFRSIIKNSKNNELRNLVDSYIKKYINTYPTYDGSILALKMIRGEKIYIPSNDFDINNYVSGDSEQETGEIEKIF
jgi:uncharacterized protein (UPF0335 family)